MLGKEIRREIRVEGDGWDGGKEEGRKAKEKEKDNER